MEESVIDPVERQYKVARALNSLEKGVQDAGLALMLKLLSEELQNATEEVDSYYIRKDGDNA